MGKQDEKEVRSCVLNFGEGKRACLRIPWMEGYSKGEDQGSGSIWTNPGGSIHERMNGLSACVNEDRKEKVIRA